VAFSFAREPTEYATRIFLRAKVEEFMFCDQCGTTLESGQKFCNRCGKEITGVITGYPRRSRLQEHLRLLAILWFAFSAFEVLGSFILFIIANTIFFHPQDLGAPSQIGFLHPLLSFVAVFLFLKGAAGFLAGYGLLQRMAWARTVALVLAFLALIHVPLGTALGVYTLWVLLPAQSEAEYENYHKGQAA